MGRRQRQAAVLAAALVLVAGVGCGANSRKNLCADFVVAADACLGQAGEAAFFAENVDCESPVSTVREYKCLIDAYERAVDNDLCRDRASAELIVDFTSLSCLGWSGELSDDDDSGDDDDSAR